jgi:CRP/FNR family cyclic AMP-dependent transcriptional regulator
MPKHPSRVLRLRASKAKGMAIPKTPVRSIRNFDPSAFLSQAGLGRKIIDLTKGQTVFSQGDPAETVFYIQSGQVKLSVISSSGKEGTIALLGAKDFLGEECVANAQLSRLTTAVSMTEAAILEIDKREMIRALHEHHALSDIFVTYLLSRNVRVQADLVDQLFNSSEKRLARGLLLLAQFGKEGAPETVIPKVTQEALAEMVGTTRSRINFFMNRFRKLGFIEYNGKLTVHSSLLGVVLHD